MRLNSLLVTVFLGLFLGPSISFAEICLACSPTVRMTEHRASCLTLRLDEFVEQANSSQLGFVIFDVDACTSEDDRRRGVVPFPKPPSGSSEPDRTLVMDELGLNCLKGLVDEIGDGLSPEATFDLLKAC